MFESADPETRQINATDKRFFWIALYAQPVLWILLAVLALASLEFIWLTLVGTFTLFCGMEGKREDTMAVKANKQQLSRSSSQSRIRLPSLAATSSAKLLALLRPLYMDLG